MRRVRVRCLPGSSCAVRVKVLPRRGSTRRLGGASLRLDPGAVTYVRARLNRATRRALRRRGRLAVRIRLVLPGGRMKTVPVVLRASARR